MGEHGRDLERAHEPHACDGVRLRGRDVVALVEDAPGAGLQELGDQIEAGGLARAVGTDQGMNGAATDPQVNVSNRREPSKVLRQAAGLDDVLLAHEARVATLTGGRTLCCSRTNAPTP